MSQIRPYLSRTPEGLVYDGVLLDDLIRSYGSPLYVYSAKRIDENFLNLQNSFRKYYPQSSVCFAVKANSNLHLLKRLVNLGAGADCSNATEIAYALKAGFEPKRSLFTSVNPQSSDLETALTHGFRINLDDADLLDDLLNLGKPELISFRINPGIGAGKFSQIVVGGEGSKFGLSEERASQAYGRAKASGITHFGMHMMTGSCILDENYFVQITDKLLDIAGDIARTHKIKFDFIDIGGGFGIPYEAHEKSLNLENLARTVCHLFEKKCHDLDLGQPELVMEPGRYIVGDASLLLTKVSHIKYEKETFLGLDSGMTTLIRPALYGAHHDIIALKQSNQPPRPYTIVGPICESTDCFAKDRYLPPMQKGDILAILDTGAYGWAMSSNFNGQLRPAEILVDGGCHKLIRRAETIEDVWLAQEQVP